MVFSISCSGNEHLNLSEKQDEIYRIEVLDSLIVDYIGDLSWSDLSPYGENFLAVDRQKSDVLLINSSGKIIQILNKTGDQSESIGPNLIGRTKFRNEKGLTQFDLNRNLNRNVKPDFDPIMNFIALNSDCMQFRGQNFTVAVIGGRITEGSGFDKTTYGIKLKSINIYTDSFKGIIPFLQNSRFSNLGLFPVTNT